MFIRLSRTNERSDILRTSEIATAPLIKVLLLTLYHLELVSFRVSVIVLASWQLFSEQLLITNLIALLLVTSKKY